MNPFRNTSGDDRILALAERLVLAMRSAKVELPADTTPNALWTLAIVVANWYLSAGLEQRFLTLATINGLLSDIKSLPPFVAAASVASDSAGLGRAGPLFVVVVSELGMPKLRAALASGIYTRLTHAITTAFPPPSELMARSAVRSAESGTPVVLAQGFPWVEQRPLPKAQAEVSEVTQRFLRERYPEAIVKSILRG
jgi:hypothetical protein